MKPLQTVTFCWNLSLWEKETLANFKLFEQRQIRSVCPKDSFGGMKQTGSDISLSQVS